jgi:hypothetical protein
MAFVATRCSTKTVTGKICDELGSYDLTFGQYKESVGSRSIQLTTQGVSKQNVT